MAARKQLFHPEEVKQKIQASQLINRLQNFALLDVTDPDFAKKAMSGDQVRAAFGLLSKVVPDLKAIEHSGNAGLAVYLHPDAKKV
jgi:hypothetical protein